MAGDVVLTISQLAREAGVNVETVRYYERRGLLAAPPRTVSGYRQYSATDVWRLQLIARAKSLGFTLAEITDIVGVDRQASVDTIVVAARAKITAIDEQQRELDARRSRLERLLSVCGSNAEADCLALESDLVSSVSPDDGAGSD